MQTRPQQPQTRNITSLNKDKQIFPIPIARNQLLQQHQSRVTHSSPADTEAMPCGGTDVTWPMKWLGQRQARDGCVATRSLAALLGCRQLNEEDVI